jgi:hypothetical protein
VRRHSYLLPAVSSLAVNTQIVSANTSVASRPLADDMDESTPVLLEGVGCQYGIAINLFWLAINDRVGQQGNEQHVHRVNRIIFEFLQVFNIDCVHVLVSKEAGIVSWVEGQEEVVYQPLFSPVVTSHLYALWDIRILLQQDR